MNQSILVTGAAGFVGSHLCEALLADGHRVVGLDTFTDYYPRPRKESNLAWALGQANFTLVEDDLLAADLGELLGGVETVYHLAGQPGVRGSWGRQFETYTRNNILATQRLLEAAVAAGSVPVIYASSSSAYGNLATMPLREDMAPAPVSPYGVTKLAAEHLCGLYGAVHGLPVVSLRLFTVYGPRQRPDMAFQRFLTAVQQGRPITVFGDGSQTRDFTYVGDVVRAFQLAGAWCNGAGGSPGSYGRRFNVAGGSRASVQEVLELLHRTTGIRPQVRYQPAQPGDVRDTWADTSLARRHLGFEARLGLADGLARQWRHVQGQG